MNKICLVLLALALSSCAGAPEADTFMRVYENSRAKDINPAIQKSFDELGYLTNNAKWMDNKVTNSKGVRSKSTASYKYGEVTRETNNCQELADVLIIDEKSLNLVVVQLRLFEAVCSSTKNDTYMVKEKDKSKYNRFFSTLSKITGKKEGRITLDK